MSVAVVALRQSRFLSQLLPSFLPSSFFCVVSVCLSLCLSVYWYLSIHACMHPSSVFISSEPVLLCWEPNKLLQKARMLHSAEILRFLKIHSLCLVHFLWQDLFFRTGQVRNFCGSPPGPCNTDTHFWIAPPSSNVDEQLPLWISYCIRFTLVHSQSKSCYKQWHHWW